MKYAKIIRPILGISVFLVAVLVFGVTAQAQAEDLGTIEVTSGRYESSSDTSSKPVTIIDRKTIEASHVENVVDLLRGEVNIVVRDSTGTGAKSQVDLGGFGESSSANLVVLIDGRRVNSPDLSGVDWTQVPVDQIERIEIVHGGSSVLYGDGAVGGVINIITRIPETGGKISLNGGSFGTFSGLGRIGADADRMRVETNISGISTNGYRDNNVFERFDGGGRAEVDLPLNLGLRLSGNYHRDRVGLPGSLTADQMIANRKQASNPADFSRTTDSFIDGGLNWASNFGLELDVAGGVRRRDVHSEFPGFNSISDFVNRTRSIRPKINLVLGGNYPVHIIAGADIDRGDGSFNFGGAVATTGFNRNRDGYYGRIEVRPSEGRLTVSGGMRSERVQDAFSQTVLKSVSNRLTAWEAGASLGLTDHLRLRLNTSRSIRFPLLDERFNFFTGAVNTTLLPQTGQHYSGALHYGDRSVWAEVAISRASLDNEIFFNPVTFSNENYRNTTRHDLLTLSGYWWLHDWLQLSGNYTYSRAEFRGGLFDGKKIPAVPNSRFGLNWRADWSRGFNTVVRLSYVGNSFLISDQANARTPLHSYVVLDAIASYHWRDFEMFARMDNLTNRKYSSYGVFSPGFPPFTPPSDNFFPSPEISVRAGVSYAF